MKIDRVVVGMDFSEPAIRAARWAAQHVAPQAELVIVHALEMPVLPDFLRGHVSGAADVIENARRGATDRLAELCRSICPEGNMRGVVRAGGAVDAILDVVAETRADLVVVGEHGRRAGVLDALGSTAERLLHSSPVPVLLGRGAEDHPPASILIPVEEADVTSLVLRWGAELARRFDAAVALLHVITSQIPGRVRIISASGASREFEAKLESSARAWLEQVARDAGFDPERTSSDVVFGETRWEVLAAAQRLDVDLIVMGSRGSGTAGQILLGSVARSVLRGAHCPVLVITQRDEPS
jgi:nucleotide-binding universal stress UspA family protein